MTGRLSTTTTAADGRSPAASALWDPNGALLPVPPGAVRVPLFFSKSSAPRVQSFTAPGSASRTKLAAAM
jgi:hypothetical protein